MKSFQRRRAELLAVALILSTHSAVANPPPLADPDTQAARRHYDRGVVLYNQEHYADAAREFDAARRLKPLPAFDYNIGRADERLEQWGAAADAFDRYAATLPDGKEASELRARIAILRARASDAPTAPDASPSITSRWWFWTAIGAVVVAGAAVGIGVAASGIAHTPSATTTDGTFTVRY